MDTHLHIKSSEPEHSAGSRYPISLSLQTAFLGALVVCSCQISFGQSRRKLDASPIRISIGASTTSEEQAYRKFMAAQAQILPNGLPAGRLQDLPKHFASLGFPATIDVRSLDDLGLSPSNSYQDVPGPISTVAAMEIVLDPLDLCVSFRSGTVHITSIESAEANQSIRVYDVTALTPVQSDGLTDVDTLWDLITTNVSPETWDEVGGPASMSAFLCNRRTLLVITQTDAVHRKIEQVLVSMHRMARVSLPTAPKQLDLTHAKPISVTPRVNRAIRRSSRLPRTRL